MITSQIIRQRYLDYMKVRAHAVISRASLVPSDDPTTLFTSSGMQPLLPYLLGASHPQGHRLVNSQVCLRTQDIEEVGDSSHTTCFEMLGNWSLGDYFKEEQLAWFFDFLVDEIGLDADRIYTTCFRGDDQHGIPEDEASARILQNLYKKRGIEAKIVDLKTAAEAAIAGMQSGRIFYYDDAENWWSRGGGIAETPMNDPAGGDCEFFFDFGADYHDEQQYGQPHPATDSGRFLEIGNSVFMEYQRQAEGFKPLAGKNVDFGGGLERITAAALGEPDVFKTDLLYPLIKKLESLAQTGYETEPANFRIVADHMRAVAWLAVDGVAPSNKEQGYVMRRLLRRAQLKASQLHIASPLSEVLLPLICTIYASAYPEFVANQTKMIEVLQKEEKTFRQTLGSGLREFKKSTAGGALSGDVLFRLYDTYGFPKELSLEEAAKEGLKIDENALKDFDALMLEQRRRSQTSSIGEYKGGLADNDPMTIQYHTATHLMYKALRLVLGEEVQQRGSNITAQRLRFDFSYGQKVNSEQIKEIEEVVNQQIEADWPVSWEVMETDKALKTGVLGAFGDKYGPKVRVYSIGKPGQEPYSREICGGPHVGRTAELGGSGRCFKIIKEEACAAGIRRIKAVLA